MNTPNIEETIEATLKNADKKSMLEHLQAPRRKRRNYVFLAVGPDIDSNLLTKVEQFISLNFPVMTVHVVPSLADLEKLLTKQVNLIIVSDGFAPFDRILPLLRQFKETNLQTGFPILFLTRDEENLISKYQSILAAYQETDDYLALSGMSDKHLLAKIQERLNPKIPHRRARRFPANLSVRYTDLKSGKFYSGVIEDISLFGCLLAKDPSAPQFTKFDQIRIFMPNEGFISKQFGDSIPFFARTSRVLLGGERTGLTWAQMSEEKHAILFKILTEMVGKKLVDTVQREKNAEIIRRKNVR
jgi:hypothetical protein